MSRTNNSAIRRSWGTAKQLPSKRWQASYIGPDKNRHNAPNTFPTRAAADAWLALRRGEIDREVWKPPATITAEKFGAYADAWLASRTTRSGTPLRPTTAADYRHVIEKYLECFTPLQLSAITPARVRSWHAGIPARTQAGKCARVLRAILNTAVADGVIQRNPVPPELCRTRAGIEHRPPTLAEVAALLDAITPRFKLAVVLAAYGGLRLSEWRALRQFDLTEADGHWLVNVERQAARAGGRWVVGPPKSADGTRVQALPGWASPLVADHLTAHAEPGPGGLLFPAGGTGEFVDVAWRRAWDGARVAAGVSGVVRGHDLRHFYATQLAAAGASAPQLKTALGHATISMSMAYVHSAKGASPQLADLLPEPGVS